MLMVENMVVHIITSSGVGGAEKMLFKLFKNQPKRQGLDVIVVLGNPGEMHQQFRSVCTQVYTFGISKMGFFNFWEVIKVIKACRSKEPLIIQGWMYHGNLIAFFLFLLSPKTTRLFWTIRQTLYSLANEKIATRIVIWVGKVLSKFPENIIYNSYLALKQHEDLGFAKAHSTYIPNCFEMPNWRRVKQKHKLRSRSENDKIIVAHIARWHPMKGHDDFLELALHLSTIDDRYHFLMAGKGVTSENTELVQKIEQLEVRSKVELRGLIENVSDLLDQVDAVVSTSRWGEGFPNILGEAVLSGTKAFATNVGDCKLILDDESLPESGDIRLLTEQVQHWFALSDREKSLSLLKQFRRMKRLYSPEVVINKFNNIYYVRKGLCAG